MFIHFYFPDRNALSSASVSAVALVMAAYSRKMDNGAPIRTIMAVGNTPKWNDDVDDADTTSFGVLSNN